MHSSDDDDKTGGNTNGSALNGANGHDKNDEDKVVRFPSLADRDRIRKQKEAQEKQWQKEYKAAQKAEKVPFLNMPNIPPFIRVIVPLIVLVQVFQTVILDVNENFQFMYHWGFVPAHFTEGFTPMALVTPVTYMLLHGGWMHTILNALMLGALGAAFERLFGTVRSIQFFIACGLLGALIHFLIDPAAQGPLVGASGAISGYFASFLLVAHWRGAVPLTGPLAKYGIWPLVGLWLFILVGLGVLMGGTNIAWAAHLGGFIGGMFITTYFAKGRWTFWK